ncbi:TonB-dependent receptor domain-containing protein [Sphingomonas jaspsi]|uniref:TonB-dependent receptor domain-containing protein n=1 Tax=Sphingomonas jaspsi TaxID=392409 RepID=UPI0004AD9EC3|nr:TonB-dependent receptor [Sphingomonas jaspsi]
MSFRSTWILSTSALALTVGITAPAFAQDAETPVCAEGQTENCTPPAATEAPAETTAAPTSDGQAITVTGTRIQRPTLNSSVPVTTVSVQELTDTGDVSLGDALNDLPSLRSTFSQGNSTRFIGTAGLNLLDLRGLGTARTLVLVNGKRHITATPGDYLVDTNTIPVDLLERVDVVTGGSSAVYGSDAVAGVVNFVLKRDFEGFQVKAQDGVSSRGDRANKFVSATFGRNFDGGRGNVAVSAEWAKSDPLYFRDRDGLTGAYSGRCQFQTVEPTGGEPFGSDGIFDTAFVCGVKNGSISDGGTVARVGVGQYLRFDANGNLFVDVPAGNYEAGGSANILGGQGSTLRNTGQLAAGLQRWDVNLLAHYEVSEAFVPYIEAKYVNVHALQEGQPSFFTSVPGTLGGPSIKCDNAFLTDQALGVLQSTGRCLAGRTNTQSIPLARFNIDFGGRGEKHVRETYRIVGGFEGTFNEDWHYDFSLNYGKLKTKLDSLNNLLLFTQDGNDYAGFNLAIDSVLVGGVPTCRINADADPTNNDPACVPINVFGYGQPSQAALDYVNVTGHRKERATEFDALFTLNGDLSQLFELPGGPIAFAIGSEYRKEKAYSAFDDLTASGATFLNAIQPFNPPNLTVKEAFGELDVPLLKKLPFAEELSVHGAARVSKYNSNTGRVWAWNLDAIYAPVRDIRFRAAKAVSVRAPTQSDLYSPQSQNFAFIGDPCDEANITANPNRAANCAAAGVPTTYNAATVAACAGSAAPGNVGDPWRNCLARTASTGFLSGGNPTLVEERGKSLTLGVVIEPRWIPGLNFTIDYYKIQVDSLISALGAQQIISLCYDSASGINNPFCATVNRDPATGLFVEPAVISGGVNFAAQKTKGIDFDLSYRHSFSNGQRLSLRLIANHLLRLDNFTDPTRPDLPNRQMSELGDPRWAANFSANYDLGVVDFSYSARFIGKQTIGTWEQQHQYTGVCPASGITGSSGRTCTAGELATLDPQNNDAFPRKWYPSALYHNVRIGFDIAKKFNFYVGADNVFDKKPPYGLLGTAGGDPYDTYGRYYYAGVRLNY